jgi:hypothetical protein
MTGYEARYAAVLEEAGQLLNPPGDPEGFIRRALDGSTGSYAFGSPVKVRLLKEEGVPVEEVARAPYVATPTTGVFCHATCRHARRISPENRRPFRSAREAAAAGYRPCRVCRPAVPA